VNDVDFEEFFTGAHYFTVKEIEVFEIAHYTADDKNCCLFSEMTREGNGYP
jgi:hypothetical protein